MLRQPQSNCKDSRRKCRTSVSLIVPGAGKALSRQPLLAAVMRAAEALACSLLVRAQALEPGDLGFKFRPAILLRA